MKVQDKDLYHGKVFGFILKLELRGPATQL